MKIHNVIQGSGEWLALRALPNVFTASDAAALMGASPYATRADLLRRKATGIVEEVTPQKQALFDRGHATEALFRPHAEDMLDGEDLAPVTGSIEIDGLTLLASFDGLTFDRSTGFEHKLFNVTLAKMVEADGEPGPSWYWQLEHQLLVMEFTQPGTRCRILFVTSDGTRDCMAHCIYQSKPERRAQLIAAWKLFAEDLAAYKPEPAAAVVPVGRTPENLPALHIEISGQVRASNLASFHEHAMSVLKGINRELTTDQHFSDADKTVKWCEDVESRLAAAKDHALSQTASIEALFRTIDDVSAETRAVRLELSKLVKARKESLRGDIVAGGITRYREHMEKLNKSLGADLMPKLPVDFGASIAGKRSFQAMRDAVDQLLADAKMAASDTAHRIAQNLRTLEQHAEHAHLFADRAQLVLKMPEDLQAVVTNRVNEHLRKEAERQEQERERIRAEEVAKLQQQALDEQAANEAAAKRQAEAAIQTAATPAPAPAPTPAPAVVAQPLASTLVAAQKSASVSHDEKPTMKLGEICARLRFTVTADFLAELGFAAVVDKNARLYPPSQFPAICSALIEHLNTVADEVPA